MQYYLVSTRSKLTIVLSTLQLRPRRLGLAHAVSSPGNPSPRRAWTAGEDDVENRENGTRLPNQMLRISIN